MTTTSIDTPRLRGQLAENLSIRGYLRTAPWHEAVLAVPREHFLTPGVFLQHDQPNSATTWEPVLAESADPDGWAQMAYQDTTWVTQLDGAIGPADVLPGTRATGIPSSSTMPSLVMRMREDLQVESGMGIGEIGIGTGYSTALGCARAESQNVVSIEIDPVLAARAATALHACGYEPKLLVGDGLAGLVGVDGFHRLTSALARVVEADPALVDDWSGRFVAAMAVRPNARSMWLRDTDWIRTALAVTDGLGSWAMFDLESATVDRGGPLPLWDQIERSLTGWHDAGSPPQSRFQLIIDGGQQFVSHPGMGRTWTLPAS